MAIPQLHSLISQGEAELKSELKPAGPIEGTLMGAIYLEKVYVDLVTTFS